MTNDTQTAVYTDFSGLANLRRNARQDPEGSLRAVAQQFEAIFMQLVLKSMRDASMGDTMFDSEQSDMYREMYDKQIAMSLSEKGGLGIADALVRQLSRQPTQPHGAEASASGSAAASMLPAMDGAAKPLLNFDRGQSLVSMARGEALTPELPQASAGQWFEEPLQFVHAIWDHAKHAATALGTVPEVLVAQAALETGWGQRMLPGADGGSSNNLFGIKADERWEGERVAAQTLEFREGVMAQERASFRAYPSLGASFSDYVQFLKSNPRYRNALAESGDPQRFVAGLQRAGYATDPEYANKIKNIMNSDTLREALGALNL